MMKTSMRASVWMLMPALLISAAAVAEDRIVATEIHGGLPLLGKDGKPVPSRRTVLAEIRGAEFEELRGQVRALVRLMGAEVIWWDVGPDASYVSAVIELGGEVYTLNSWYPLFRGKEDVAVTDHGLVACSSRQEKLKIEGRRSEKYRALVIFFDAVLAALPDIQLSTVEVGDHLLRFYVDLEADSAVLGFSVEDDSGRVRYFPLYGSTYRGLPAVTLEVFASDAKDEMWVRSSWERHTLLAHQRLGADRCMTRYGEISSSNRPTPGSLGGGTARFPAVNPEKVSKVATIDFPGTDAVR